MLFIWNMASMLLVFNITCMVSPPSTIMGIAENFDLNLGERNLIFSVIGGTHYSILKVLIFFSSWFTHTHTSYILHTTPHFLFISDLQLPYFKDTHFISKIHSAVVRPDVQVWQTPGIKYAIQFCWGVFVRSCSNHPHLDDFADIFEEDEGILDSAIDGDALKYLRKSVIESQKFHEEVNYYFLFGLGSILFISHDLLSTLLTLIISFFLSFL